MLHRPPTLACLTLLALPVGAQDHWERETIEIDPTFGGSRIEIGDFNLDGWPDPVLNGFTWYENPSTSPFGGWIERVIANVNGSDRFAVVDVDGDGDEDVLHAGGLNGLQWWEKQFEVYPGFTAHAIGTGSHAIASGDLDGDGTPDAVSWSEGPGLVAWLNTAGNATVWQELPIGASGRASRITLGDVDLDGDLDVFVTSNAEDGDGMAWYEQPDDGGAWTAHPIDPTLQGQYVTGSLADLDGDGDLDTFGVVTTFQGGVQTRLVWHANGGDGTSWTSEEILLPGSSTSVRCDAAADMDSDGDLDLVGVLYLDATVFWLENGADWALHSIADPAAISLPDDVEPFDADLDCDPDLAVLARDLALSDDGLFWYENRIDPSAQLVRLGSPPNPCVLQPADANPNVAGRWEPILEYEAFPDATAALLIVSLAPAELPLLNGSLLIDLGTTVLQQSLEVGAQPLVLVPDACSLLGVRLHAQAAFLAPDGLWPTNALDIAIGPR